MPRLENGAGLGAPFLIALGVATVKTLPVPDFEGDQFDRRQAMSRTTLLHLEQVCDRFEAAWQAGQRPCVEEYLGEMFSP